MFSVKRVVVTSSCAAIYGDNADIRAAPNGRIDEGVWNTSSSVDHQPYSYSKTLAESEAWAIAQAQDQWDLVTINPSLVIGPSLGPVPSSASFDLLKQFGEGTMASGVPRFGMGVVDVRDVAAAHVAAGLEPAAQGRYIVSGHDTDFTEIAAVLRRHFGDAYPIPKRVLPKWLVWLVGPWMNDQMTRPLIARNVGFAFRADNSKSVRDLGMAYRPMEDALVEMFQQMIDQGLLPAPA